MPALRVARRLDLPDHQACWSAGTSSSTGAKAGTPGVQPLMGGRYAEGPRSAVAGKSTGSMSAFWSTTRPGIAGVEKVPSPVRTTHHPFLGARPTCKFIQPVYRRFGWFRPFPVPLLPPYFEEGFHARRDDFRGTSFRPIAIKDRTLSTHRPKADPTRRCQLLRPSCIPYTSKM